MSQTRVTCEFVGQNLRGRLRLAWRFLVCALRALFIGRATITVTGDQV